MSENRGEVVWKFPTAEPIIEPPAVLDDHVFVATQLGGMFCCDAKTGKQLWWAPEIIQFVAASKQRVYAADRIGRTQVLDLKTGARLDDLATELLPVKLLNSQTDRLYLATDTGLVQCLHEIEQARPILHGEDRKAKPVEEPEKPVLGARKPKADHSGDEEKPKPKATPRPKAAADKPARTPKAPKDKPLKKAVKAKADQDAGTAKDAGAGN